MKKVLFVSESSYLASGYGVYAFEILNRLFNKNKYEIAELISYTNTKNNYPLPWKTYFNKPLAGEEELFQSEIINQFGAYSFERVCIDFQPDVVISIRDFWMDEFIQRSPFRKMYDWIYMPPVDCYPQDNQWMDTFINADFLLSYTDWGGEVLKEQSNNKVNYMGTASPSADLNIFKYLGKEKVREEFDLPVDINIIGTCMRNQKRKLFPDLIESFKYIQDEKTYLYLHTAYPDLGWDIPRLIHEAGVNNRVLMTYKCDKCHAVFPALYSDATTFCRYCGELSCFTPGTGNGVSREVLAKIYNVFDIYVQYANCLKAGTEVLIKDGWKAIEDVKIGDEAFTHNGKWQKVINTFKHERGDRPLDISVWGDYESLTITSEHPVYAIINKKLSKQSIREQIGSLLSKNKIVPNPEFVKSEELTVGDMLAYIIDDSIEDVTKIDLSNYANKKDAIFNQSISVKNGKTYPRYIEVNNEYCRWLGLYVADGNSTVKKGTNSVRVTCNIKDVENQELSILVMGKVNGATPKLTYYKNRKAVNIENYGCLHAKFLKDNCKKSLEKQLPIWSLKLPKEKQLEILKGLFLGDGYYVKDRNVSVYVTISKTLAEQIKCLLRRNRIYFNVRIVKKNGNRQNQYRFEVQGDIKNGRLIKKIKNTSSIYIDNIHYMKIKSIKKSDYNGYVYNFEVENDNSYVTKITTVHNSEGFGLPIVEAAACEVPVMAVDYSGMYDVVRKVGGTPIPVKALSREAETHGYRAIPDNEAFIRLVKEKLLDKEKLREEGKNARKLIEENITYDIAASSFEKCIDLAKYSNGWNSKVERFIKPDMTMLDYYLDETKFVSNEQFVRWCISTIMGRPDLVDSYMSIRLTRDLNWGYHKQGMGGVVFNDASNFNLSHPVDRKSKQFNRKVLVQELLKTVDIHNYWEEQRLASLMKGGAK